MPGRYRVQLMVNDLQVYRYRLANNPDITRAEREDAIWWLTQEIEELLEMLDTFCFRKAG